MSRFMWLGHQGRITLLASNEVSLMGPVIGKANWAANKDMNKTSYEKILKEQESQRGWALWRVVESRMQGAHSDSVPSQSQSYYDQLGIISWKSKERAGSLKRGLQVLEKTCIILSREVANQGAQKTFIPEDWWGHINRMTKWVRVH